MSAPPQEAQIQQWFQAIDVDRTGSINAAELQRAMALGGLNFSLQACAQMVRLHDRDSSGTITLDEFRSLHMQLSDIKSRFAAAAGGGDSISFDQLQQLVAQQGYRLEPPAFKALALAFDPDRNGAFGLPEFTVLQLFLLAARNVFAAFDPQQTGKITLDFSQFVYSASQTK